MIYTSDQTKTFLLLQARMKRVKMPLADYVNDLKSVLDQALRILNAIVDVAADAGLLSVVLLAMETTQLIVQGRLPEDSPLLQVPHVNSEFTVKLCGEKTTKTKKRRGEQETSQGPSGSTSGV